MTLRATYDSSSDYFYISLGHYQPGSIAETAIVDLDDAAIPNSHIAIHLADDGKVIGIEFGGATKLVSGELLHDFKIT